MPRLPATACGSGPTVPREHDQAQSPGFEFAQRLRCRSLDRIRNAEQARQSSIHGDENYSLSLAP